FIYGTVTQGGNSVTVGVQKDSGSLFTQFECNTASTLAPGLMITFQQPPCATATIIPPPLATNTATVTPLPTATAPPTSAPTASATAVPPTVTPCLIQFSDVDQQNPFY